IIHLAMPAARPSTVSYQVRGDLRVDQVSPGAGFGRRITGRLFGIGSVRSVINGAAQPERSGALDAAVVLTLSAPAGQPAALDVQVQGQGRSYAISATWTTQPLQMSVAVSVRQREVI